jgi:IPT/TIG domain
MGFSDPSSDPVRRYDDNARARCYVMTWTVRASVALFLASSLSACGADRSPVAPGNSVFPQVPTPSVDRLPTPSVDRLSIAALSVTVGSTLGGTPMKITGTGLGRGANVTFGSVTVTSSSYDPRDASGSSLLIDTPAHVAGVVDVTVSSDGQTFRLSRGYEYVPQESFDFNGDWDGVTTNGTDALVQFTITNSKLVTASCRTELDDKVVTLSGAVMDGQFSAEAGDGSALSGRLVSATQAVGRITAPQCLLSYANPWRADKLGR